ncbi:uncharacterized protein LOC6561263 [Drosophila grimshawi]|uniref:GH21570 n=1 Tax=Drosophila grimshawi TaxID=7222 RepID=B4J4W5_DROGR|nr:uncharacterized protein LOC6561263 [Drosophila grimshawi]EDW01671.1 GH21570 [Drosophila grimshawi]
MLSPKLLIWACFLLFIGLVSAISPGLLKEVSQQNQNGASQHKHEIKVDNGSKTSAQGNVNGHTHVRVTRTADSTGFHPHIN